MFWKSFGFRLSSSERGYGVIIYKMDLTKTAKRSIENAPLDTESLLPYILAYKIYKYII